MQVLYVRAPKKLVSDLQSIADKMTISRSALVRMMLVDAIKQYTQPHGNAS